ncbi:MAG: nucleotide sugar dehydrogenase [Candidatus Woesearchaeota archaeon]
MKVCVLGLGYIGLPTALLIAASGHKVLGFDINKKLVNQLKTGKINLNEKGIKILFKKARKNFKVVTKIENSDAFIVCVPTPLNKNKKCNLKFVKKAAEDISNVLSKGNLVVLESTVPPGTTRNIFKKILEKKGLKEGRDFFLSFVSEKAIPGNAIYEMQNNIRVIGVTNKKSGELTKKLYSSFVRGKLIQTTLELAEISKLMENTYRDVNIALANEFKRICDDLNIDVFKAIELANLHPRVNILKPGVGVGGYCLTKDPWFLLEKTKHGKLIKMSRLINDTQPKYVVEIVKKIIKRKGIKKPVIGLMGISYKPNVSDIRESPMIKIYNLLEKRGFEVLVTDPLIKKIDNIKITTKNEIIKKAHIIIDYYNIQLNKNLIKINRAN